METHHTKDVLENHLKDQSFRLVHWLSITIFSAKDQSRIHQFGKKVLPGLFLKGDVLVADFEELETMDASEIYSKTQCEGGDISQRKWKIYFASRRWTNHTSWRRSGNENIHLDTAASNSRRKSRRFSWRIRRVSSTTSRLISGCR